MNCRVLFALAVVAALPTAACERARSADSAVSTVRSAPTFNKDIAPIVFEQCATCHRPVDPADSSTAAGDPKCFAGAPFPLLEYRDVRAHAGQVAEATRTRIMPPWLPERGDAAFAD